MVVLSCAVALGCSEYFLIGHFHNILNSCQLSTISHISHSKIWADYRGTQYRPTTFNVVI